MNARTTPAKSLTAGIVSLVFAVTMGLSNAVMAQDKKAADKEGAKPEVIEDTPLYVDKDAGSLHDQLFIEQRYPSAHTCGQCHPQHFREWSVSPHAYATFSPVFQAFNGTLLKRTNGTLGDFCIRCHAANADVEAQPARA
jgi:cytochrome c553